MAGIGENEVPFDLVSSLLDYIKTLDFPGAVLGFLPGRSQIFSPLKQLQQHPVFGGLSYRQVQRAVF